MTEYDVENLRQLARDGLIRWDDNGQVYLDPTNLPRFPSETVIECETIRQAIAEARDQRVGTARWSVEMRQYADGEGDRSAQGGGSYWKAVRDLVVACSKLDMTAEQIAAYGDVDVWHVQRFMAAPKYDQAALMVRDHGMSIAEAARTTGVNASHLGRKLAEQDITPAPQSRIPPAVLEHFDALVRRDATRPKAAWQATQDMDGAQLFTYTNARQRVHKARKRGDLPPAGFATWSDYKDGIRAPRS